MQPSSLDAMVLRAAAIGHDRGGSDETQLRLAVNHFERIGLDDDELGRSLARLRAHGAIQSIDGRHFLTEAAAAALPRTAGGKPSFAQRYWPEYVAQWVITDERDC